MSKKIEEKIIKDIKSGSIKMRPKWLFVIGSLITGFGVILTTSLALLAIQLIRFRLNHPGLSGAIKVNTVITSLPWYIPVIAVTAIVGGYLALKQYDFSYRKNSAFIMILVIVGLVFGSFILDKVGADQILMKRGYFRRIYNQENISSPMPSLAPRDGSGRGQTDGGKRDGSGKGMGNGRNQINQSF